MAELPIVVAHCADVAVRKAGPVSEAGVPWPERQIGVVSVVVPHGATVEELDALRLALFGVAQSWAKAVNPVPQAGPDRVLMEEAEWTNNRECDASTRGTPRART